MHVCTYFPSHFVLVNSRVNKTRGSRAGHGTNSGTYSAAIWTWIFVGGREHRRRATGYLLPFSPQTVHPLLDAYKHEERRCGGRINAVRISRIFPGTSQTPSSFREIYIRRISCFSIRAISTDTLLSSSPSVCLSVFLSALL